MQNDTLSYVLITPAYNAADLIEKTIASVVSQTVLPLKWIIANDGSTDDTERIARSYADRYDWIEVFTVPRPAGYDLSAKARVFNAAWEKIRHLKFDVIANIDSDISFDATFFAYFLSKFQRFPSLGVTGAPMREGDHDAVEDGMFNETDVFGACQIFRRECLEAIGGYLPIRGGVDWCAVRMARMKGWDTRSFLEKRFFHHRVMGATDCGPWLAMIKQGRKDYYLGNHLLWQLFRVLYQMKSRPFVLRGALVAGGFLWESVTGMNRPIPRELVQFHRWEQMRRFRSLLLGKRFPEPLKEN